MCHHKHHLPSEAKTTTIIIDSGLHPKTVFGIDKDYLSILIPIFTFLLGYLLAYIIRKINSRKKAIQTKEYLTMWIDLILPQLDTQINDFKKFSRDAVDYNSLKNIEITNIHVDKLKTITPQELKLLIINNSIGSKEHLNKLLFILSEQLDFISDQQENALQNFGDYKSLGKEYTAQYNSVIVDFSKEINRTIVPAYASGSKDPFVNEVYNIQKQLSDRGQNFQLSFVLDDIMIPLEEVCEKHLAKSNHTNTQMMALLQLVYACKGGIKRLKAHGELTAKTFEQIFQSLEKTRDNLAIANKSIKKLEIKFICE